MLLKNKVKYSTLCLVKMFYCSEASAKPVTRILLFLFESTREYNDWQALQHPSNCLAIGPHFIAKSINIRYGSPVFILSVFSVDSFQVFHFPSPGLVTMASYMRTPAAPPAPRPRPHAHTSRPQGRLGPAQQQSADVAHHGAVGQCMDTCVLWSLSALRQDTTTLNLLPCIKQTNKHFDLMITTSPQLLFSVLCSLQVHKNIYWAKMIEEKVNTQSQQM